MVFSAAPFRRPRGCAARPKIARTPTSVPGVALDLAKKTFHSLQGHPVLLVGAGEMIELTAKCLGGFGREGFFDIANRTFENARNIAQKLGGTPLALEEGLHRLDQVDILLTSAAGGILVTNADLSRTVKSRGGKPLFIIDIGSASQRGPGIWRHRGGASLQHRRFILHFRVQPGQKAESGAGTEVILKEEVDNLCHWLIYDWNISDDRGPEGAF